MNDAECYEKLYGKLVFCVPFYRERFTLIDGAFQYT